MKSEGMNKKETEEKTVNQFEKTVNQFDNAVYNERINRGKNGYSYHMEEYYRTREKILHTGNMLSKTIDLLEKTKQNLSKALLTCELLVPHSEAFQTLLKRRIEQIDELVKEAGQEFNYNWKP